MLQGLVLAGLLVRARTRMFRNRLLRRSSRLRVALSLVALVAALLGVVLFAWLPETVAALGLPHLLPGHALGDDIAAAVGLGLLGYLVLLAYGSLLFTISALLASDDLQLLLPAPWPVGAVMAAKVWLRAGTLLLISLALVLPLAVITPVAAGQPAAVLVVVVVLAVYPLLPVALVGLLVLPLVRLVPASRAREVIGGLSLLLALGIQVANLLFNPAYGGRGIRAGSRGVPHISFATAAWLPNGWAARAIGAAFNGEWATALAWLALLVGTTAVVLGVSVAVMSRVYISGWVTGADAGSGSRRRAGQRANLARPTRNGWLERLGVPVEIAAVVRRDWLLRRRDVVLLLRLLLPTVALGFVIIRSMLEGITSLRGLGPGPAAALIAAAPAAIVLFTMGSSLGLSAVSLEGRSIWIYAGSPNSMGRLLVAKLVGALPLEVGMALAAAAVLEVLVAPGIGWALGGLVAIGVYGACVGTVTVAIGGMFPNLTWNDPRRMVSASAGLLGVLATLVLTPVLAAAIGIPVGIAYLADLPRLPMFLLGLFLLIVLAGGIAAAAFAAARSRLDRLDLSLDVSAGLE